MASAEDIQPLLRLATIRAIIKYSGGTFKGPMKNAPGGRKNTPAKSTIISGHFTKGNSKFYPPLEPSYEKSKKKRVGKKPMLVFSGQMKKSIVGRAVIMPKGRDGFKVTFPNAKSYAKFQEAHGRPPTKLQDSDVDEFEQAVVTALKQLLQAAQRKR